MPAPDVNTNEQIMAWVMDTYSMHVGHTETAVVTGKPLEMGGSLGRREATGRGVMIVTREVGQAPRLRHQGRDGRRAGIRQRRLGLGDSCSPRSAPGSSPSPTGKAASTTRRASTSRSCSTTSPQHKTVDGFPGGEPLTNDAAVRARRRHPDSRPRSRTRSRWRTRRRSAPRSSSRAPTARRRPTRNNHLHERGVFVVPDILANSGGVTASYFEWVQDRYGYFWTEKEVNERLEAKMCEAFNAVSADLAEVQGRHAHRRLHRRHQPRRNGHANARDVRVGLRLRPGGLARDPEIDVAPCVCPRGLFASSSS